MSPLKINKVASTYWNTNKHWADSLADQRADYIVGGVLLCLSFSFQFAATLIPSTIQPDFLQHCGCAIAEILGGISLLLISSVFLRIAIAKSAKRRIRQIQEAKQASQNVAQPNTS